MEKYSFVSENMLKYTNWHDCLCENFRCLNSNWYMKLLNMEIEAEHPLNPYNKIYLTDDCVVIFEKPVIIDCEADINNSNPIIINDELDLNHLNLYSYYENDKISRKYKYAEIAFMTDENDFFVIEFLFKKSIMMWNRFDKISWHEDEYCRKNRTEYYKKYNQIMNMLSENNPKEVQQKGIELAREIRYIDDLLQPYFENKSKSLWKNCAKVISERKDDDLKNWMLVCSFWLQDMNHPGAGIIAERLKAFSDKDKLLREKEKAIKIAKIIGDKKWHDNIKKWL